MKVWLATAGEYSDYRVLHVFAREEDARTYSLGEDVEERELREGPVEVRARVYLAWSSWLPDREATSHHQANPYVYTCSEDYDAAAGTTHRWDDSHFGRTLSVHGWDREGVMKVYSEQRVQHAAKREGIADA